MKIAIFGAGRMGSLLGAFAARSGADVTLIDPYKEHIDAINRDGLTICNNDDPPFTVKENLRGCCSVEELSGTADLIVVLVNGRFTEQVARDSLRIADSHTYILTLQNGMGNVETIEKYYPRERMLYGVMPYGGTVLGPGKVKTLINPTAESHFGSCAFEEPNEFMLEFARLFQSCGLNFYADKKSRLDAAVWFKMAKNCSGNGVCAVTSLPLGAYMSCKEGLEVKDILYKEVQAVARAKGIEIPEEKPTHGDPGSKMFYHVSSTAQDVRDHKLTEIDNLHGAIARMGDELGIPTPYNHLITSLVKIIEQNYEYRF